MLGRGPRQKEQHMRGMELGESRARRETPRGAPRGSPAAALTKRHTPAAPSTDAYSLSGQGPPTSAPLGDAPSLPLPAFDSCLAILGVPGFTDAPLRTPPLWSHGLRACVPSHALLKRTPDSGSGPIRIQYDLTLI